MEYPLTAKQRFPMTKMRYEQAASRLSASERRRRCDEGIRKIRLSDKQLWFLSPLLLAKKAEVIQGRGSCIPARLFSQTEGPPVGHSKEGTV